MDQQAGIHSMEIRIMRHAAVRSADDLWLVFCPVSMRGVVVPIYLHDVCYLFGHFAVRRRHWVSADGDAKSLLLSSRAFDGREKKRPNVLPKGFGVMQDARFHAYLDSCQSSSKPPCMPPDYYDGRAQSLLSTGSRVCWISVRRLIARQMRLWLVAAQIL